MPTVRQLMAALEALPEDDKDLEVKQEGCDCYQTWSGDLDVMPDVYTGVRFVVLERAPD